jgi:NADPH:quinone reductase-like Zn-dependent oxidoreductase
VYERYGPPDVLKLKEVDKPVPKDNEVLVRVCAATVNRTDCGIVRGKPFIIRFFTGILKPKKSIPGTEFAGEIESVGKIVTSYKAGDRVFGFFDIGTESLAEYLAISEKAPLTTMPVDITFKQAAASSEGAHYAYNFINKVKLESGQKVLVNGATGAIGSALVQLLKYHGAFVTAVCRGEHFELVRSLGADDLIDYTQEDFTKTDGIYSFIFDAVGKSTFARCKPLLEPGGVYISSELGFMAQNPILALTTSILGKKTVKFPLPSDCRRSIHLIKQLIEEGKFKAVIDKEYPLEQTVEAYKYVQTGQKVGNVVITLKQDCKA